jgi:hypothetical protein
MPAAYGRRARASGICPAAGREAAVAAGLFATAPDVVAPELRPPEWLPRWAGTEANCDAAFMAAV